MATTPGRVSAALRPVRPVPGRWAAALAALLGVGLAVPSLVGPSWLQTVSDRERGELLSQQWQWSWGRVDLTGLTGVELDLVPNPVGLAVAVALLAVGLVAVVMWTMSRGALVSLAPIGLALLAGRLLTTAAERHGRSFRDDRGSEAGLSIVSGSTTAGWLETASAVVLIVALALMVVRLVASPPPLELADPAPDDPDEPPTRHTAAVSSSATLRPKGARLDGPEVELTDEEGR
jgi:uncharacterized membrane protein YgdD (TMEM256/DUF423 family)